MKGLGKINIKPENKWLFTEYCGGKVTNECIAQGKKSKDHAIRKKSSLCRKF